MAPTRIELSGTLVKPPRLGSTPSGRAVLRLSLDCGEVGEPMPLEVVVTDHEAQQLARSLAAGQRIWATGSLKAVQRGSLAGASRIQIEVMASAVAPQRLDTTDSDNESGKEADLNAGRALFPAKV
jgi:primosomal replication protein N